MIYHWNSVRKTAKQLSYRKRWLALTSAEQVSLRKIKKAMIINGIKEKMSGKKLRKLSKTLKILIALYLKVALVGMSNIFDIISIVYKRPQSCNLLKHILKLCNSKQGDERAAEQESSQAPPSRERTIESFSAAECRAFFRFLKEDLHRLLPLLKFPEVMILDNRISMSGEEVFLRGLFEMASGDNQEKISSLVFGRGQAAQSLAFKLFVSHVFNNFHHLVDNNLS